MLNCYHDISNTSMLYSCGQIYCQHEVKPKPEMICVLKTWIRCEHIHQAWKISISFPVKCQCKTQTQDFLAL